jgi:hypothetical protein
MTGVISSTVVANAMRREANGAIITRTMIP